MLDPIRLIDLSPGWISTKPERFGMGVSFLCPCKTCLASPGVRLRIWFVNPIDGGTPAPLDQDSSHTRWYALGKTYRFDTLSIEPSVDASEDGHWHGWIIDGACVDV